MAENNKSYRIRTTVGREADSFLEVKLDQDYDSLEILSLKLSDKDTYRLHNSDYGVIVGRVLANGNFGVPNAKISVFIPADENNSDLHMWELYPYTSTYTKNSKDIRYNLLPDESVKDCHKAVGTFPNKTYLLENEAILEVFDKYYIYTTRTNNAGDYLICGVPTGMQTLHMDLDLSDCGILSQRPRDFVYKGYTIEQFENPNQFKKDENLDGLSQIFSQNQPVYVKPFWGNKDNGEEIGITRADIEIAFKFEPTCVFMGSAISDNASNGVGKKCVPTNQMGAMDELTAGEGTIEMIRKTPGGHVEEFSIKGNQVINGNGVWCYQIPMNLDYMMTDEYGNMVPTDDPEKGIPTRTRVRFRASLTDMENSSQSYYRAKYLIPNNPGIDDEKVDYNFGTYTEEDSYRDLFWNGVYTVKSYIPRFQKSQRWRSERFTGIKACNYYGGNNPMPYNNLRIRLPFMFTVLCIFVKLFIKIVTLVNRIIAGVLRAILGIVRYGIFGIPRLIAKGLQDIGITRGLGDRLMGWCDEREAAIINKYINRYAIHCTYIGDGLCPDMEGWYFAPGCGAGLKNQNENVYNALLQNTLAATISKGDGVEGMDEDSKEVIGAEDFNDETSIDYQNITESEQTSVCLTIDVNYLVNCFEMNLAQEYRVIKFDFYNDWVNGVLYFPRWMRKIKRKKKYKINLKRGSLPSITTYYKDKIFGCMNAETSRVKKSRRYTQQCSLEYKETPNVPWTEITTPRTCSKSGLWSRCHKKSGMDQSTIFGKKSGLVTEATSMLGQYVYYLKPCEWKDTSGGKTRTLLFATDIVLLGTLNDCDENGLPQAFKYLNNSSYIMPTNLALTTMDDDAYIYAGKDGTVCSSTNKNVSQYTDVRYEESGATRIIPDYKSTVCAYTNTDGEQIVYEENDESIPVTEAAGIAWNYSGPGQDDVKPGLLETSSHLLERMFGLSNKRQKYLYYPGGHFIGLSCVNSDTNIKSCVNLHRICEVGATMSQRREIISGFDSNGIPSYRYYVPTGLISNVDIEGAEFRSMFATLNHRKLVATKPDEKTGYKRYDFRFLRPDGFDGSLANYVHTEGGSPYNAPVNTIGSESLSDSKTFFQSVFGNLWEQPLDYDDRELENTARRTLEYSINDYYMFRFGLNSLSSIEQRKHYLKHNSGKHSMPQYENSFYFYFGLRDGSTALDEFKKQFFSECAANNIMKSASLTVKEKIDDEILFGTAKLVIDGMVAPYDIVVSDNTDGIKTYPVTYDNDTIALNDIMSNYLAVQDYSFIIGHEYTVTVTDSVEQTLSKTFVFGASAIKFSVSSLNFRGSFTEVNRMRSAQAKDVRYGGFIKINDFVTVLKHDLSIGNGDISFEVRHNGEIEGNINSNAINYTDVEDKKWYLYFAKSVGTYELYINYNGQLISVYTTKFEDNSKINLYVACDFLAYKNAGNGATPLSSYTLNGDWKDGAPFSGANPNDWLMRHSFFRQTQDDRATYNHYIYSKNKENIAIFGQPEKGNLINGDVWKENGNNVSFYESDYDKYPEYVIEDKYSYIPSMFWSGGSETLDYDYHRNPFDAMSYTDDGRAAAFASSGITITGYSYDNTALEITLRYGGADNRFNDGHGTIVVLENGVILCGIIDTNAKSIKISYNFNVYPEGTYTEEMLSMASVYPTMPVPSMYKPFYGAVSAVTWNVDYVVANTDDYGAPQINREKLPLSYKVEGSIFNGLTWLNHFDPGNDAPNTYETYMVFNDISGFYGTVATLTANDYQPNREIPFGAGNSGLGFCRELLNISDSDAKKVNSIEYAVKESAPTFGGPGGIAQRVYTGRYTDGIDKFVLKDACSIDDSFYDNIRIKTYNASEGVTGQYTFYVDEELYNNTTFYVIKDEEIFRDLGLLVASTSPSNNSNTSSEGFCYGTYNHNAKYDKKGQQTNVKYNGSSFEFSLTKENGTVATMNASSSGALYDSGITVLHKFSLKPEFRMNISGLINILNDPQKTQEIHLSTKIHDVDPFNGDNITTLVQKYEKPYDGTKNSMVVYMLRAFNSLEVMYPLATNGIELFISLTPEESYPYNSQTVTIPVTTNTSFTVSVTPTTVDWITVSSQTYPSTTTSLQITLSENTGQGVRTARLKCTSTEDSSLVRYFDIKQEGAPQNGN